MSREMPNVLLSGNRIVLTMGERGFLVTSPQGVHLRDEAFVGEDRHARSIALREALNRVLEFWGEPWRVELVEPAPEESRP